LKDEKLIKNQTYMKTETCKLYSTDFWIFLPKIIKIDLYNSELYRFKVGAFFETQCSIVLLPTKSQSPTAGTQRAAGQSCGRPSMSMLCLPTGPTALYYQGSRSARLGEISIRTNVETSCSTIDRPCYHMFILSGMAALFLWVYYSVIGWTEQPSHSASGNTWQGQISDSNAQDVIFYTLKIPYTLWVKKLCHFLTTYNFWNIEQIFTKFGTNQSLFILNIVPEFI